MGRRSAAGTDCRSQAWLAARHRARPRSAEMFLVFRVTRAVMRVRKLPQAWLPEREPATLFDQQPWISGQPFAEAAMARRSSDINAAVVGRGSWVDSSWREAGSAGRKPSSAFPGSAASSRSRISWRKRNPHITK